MENLSCFLSDILDCIGYSREMINERRYFWKDGEDRYNINDGRLKLILAGSKAEEAPPGYTRLRLVSSYRSLRDDFTKESLFESESKQTYLSSCLFASSVFSIIKDKAGDKLRDCVTSGPAVRGNMHFSPSDTVVAFHCYHSQLLQTWKSRRRLHSWPPSHVKEAAASMLAQVVPVGSKGSCDQWREWRFCFIPSELTLTFSLNETQIKLYILLKMVAKDILKNISDEISSYIMKNVTFWLSELLPGNAFIKENLLSLLFISLRFLKLAISNWNCLPYYIIPERNLLAERLSHGSRRQLSDMIGTLLAEGPRLVLRCTKIRTAVTVSLSSPALLVFYKSKRDMIEVLDFIFRIITYINADEYVISAFVWKSLDLVLPEWRLLVIRGVPGENITTLYLEKTRSILS